MIEINGLTKIYKTNAGENDIIATNDISCNFKDSGFYFILGKSGCGKTTLLNILSGLDNYDSGQILVKGEDIQSYSEEQLDEYRNIKIGIVFQQYNLLPDMNVYDNLRLVLELQEWDCDKVNQKEFIDNEISIILKKVGLSGYENRKINQLSGGEQQRIAIARTLLKSPDIIFADEPTGNLDENTGKGIMQLLKSLSKNYLIIMVSHDKEIAYKYGDYIINMSDGQINSIDELEKRNFVYSFSVKTSTNKKYDYSNLSKKSMLDELEMLFSNSESGETIEISNIKKCKLKEDEESYYAVSERKNIRTKKLSIAYKLRLAFEFLKKRKVRLFFTTIVTALSVVLLFFSMYISFYNKEEVILKYMEENNPTTLPIYIETQYTDDFYVEHDKDLRKGDYLDKIIEESFSGITNVAKCITEQEISWDTNMFSNATLIFCNDFQGLDLDIEGCFPTAMDEIAVTDYIAKELNKSIGDIVQCKGHDVRISGIIQTDYIEYELDRKLNYGSDDDFFQFKCEYNYFTVYAKSDLLLSGQNNKTSLTMQCSDFLYSKKDSSYFNSYLEIGNVMGVSEDELIKGRLPRSGKEIVVSIDFLQNHSMEMDDVLEMEYYYKDIHSFLYNDYYSDTQNMYDYYGDGVIIVGVIETETDDATKDVYVYPDVWENMIDDNCKYYCASPLLLPMQGEYKDIVTAAAEEKILFDEPAINNIVYFQMIIQKLKLILTIILLVVMALNFILIGTFVSISINENKKNIGVLRSLGVTMPECMHIFSIEFYTIFLASISIATLAVFLINHVVNDFFSQGLYDVKYDIIKFNIIVYLVVAITECIISYISIKLPIKKIQRQKPIETIRDTHS